MSRKTTVWFEVAEDESVEKCLERMQDEGYKAVGRKEEPLFMDVDGKITPVRQLIKFKGQLKEK